MLLVLLVLSFKISGRDCYLDNINIYLCENLSLSEHYLAWPARIKKYLPSECHKAIVPAARFRSPSIPSAQCFSL